MTAALAFLLPLCAVVPGNDDPLRLPFSLQDDEPPSTRPPIFALSAHARVSYPVSSMDRDINILTQTPRPLLGTHGWGDFYPIGFGGAIQAELLWQETASGPDPVDPEFAWALGGYLAIGFDNYLGEMRTDPMGTSIEPADLTIVTFMLGPKVARALGGGFLFDGHLGIGPVRYAAVRADMVTGFQSRRGDFIRQTWAFGAELGGHAGFRTGRVAFLLGADLRVLTSPDGGGDVQLSAEILIEVSLDLGVEVRF